MDEYLPSPLPGHQGRKSLQKDSLTCAQVGAALDWSGSKVNRMETGSGRVQPSDVDVLCRFYETTDELREFRKSLARQAKTRSWWQVHGSGELHTCGSYMPPEDIDRAVRVRLERQSMISAPDAPDCWFVVSEGAVRRDMGDRELMRVQLEYVLDAVQRPSVTLQVLPFDAGTCPTTGPFTVLGFPDPEDPDVVYRDGITDAMYLEGEPHVREYNRAFDELRAAALSPRRSMQLINSVMKESTR
ncbi:DUF5753 domain-containing protein [Streptomyces sp. NPDC059906]|uniref:DUF5753 domain-containing protein n=1 Tax=Streptomyces sp. NPDC059906 TaxID=3346997 RepID=UPI003648B8D3